MEILSKNAFYRFLFNPDRKYFYLVCGLFLISFLVTKLSYFFYYPVWRTTIDIYSYCDPVVAIKNHTWPVFDLRTPAYPLFLAATYFAGIGLNGTLFIQMLSSLAACLVSVYMVYNYKRYVFFPFSICLLLFYSSGEFTSINTLIHPVSLFTDAILLFSVFLIVGIDTQKTKFLISASLLYALVIFLRPQGLFIVGIAAAAGVISFIGNRNLKCLLPLGAPMAFFFVALFTYNYFTFHVFGFSNFSTLGKLGYVIYFVEESPDYPAAMNQTIREVKLAIGDGEKKICDKQMPLAALDTVFTNDKYDNCWRFLPFIQNNNELVAKLLSRASASSGPNAWKEFSICFMRFNSMEYHPFSFYFNELRNRVNYIESGKDVYTNVLKKEQYHVVWREWEGEMVNHKVADYPVLKTETDFTRLVKQEPKTVRLLNYFEVFYNVIFSQKVWIFLYYISLLISVLLLLFNLLSRSTLDPVLLLPSIPLLNSILVSLIIPPLTFYVFPTKFFFIVSPFLILFYLIRLYGKRTA